jgi:hypothetical protein
MAERIASGEIHIELDDKTVLAGLKRVDAEFQRTMDKIDRESAEVSISADLDHLKADLKKAEAEVAAWNKKVNDAQTRGQKRYRAQQLEAPKSIVDGLKNQLEQEQKVLKARKEENKELDLTQKRMAAVEKAAQSRSRVLEAAERKRQQAAAREQRDIQRTQRLREREAAVAERIRTRQERDAERAERQRNREIAAIPSMRRQYAELALTIDKLNKARQKVKHDEKSRIVVDLKVDEAAAKMKMLEERLHKLGHPAPEIDIHIRPGQDFGRVMRKTIEDGMRRGGVSRAAHDAGALAGGAFMIGMGRSIRRAPKAMLGGLASIGTRLRGALEGLSNMTVRLGPFTATIRQAFVGLSILAPVILDVVGALGSLVAVAGSATLGLGALSAGFLGGAIPAAVGMGLVVKDVAQEFKAAKTATKAYNDAVMKYGENSGKAADKLDQLKSVMGHVTDKTAKQFAEAQNLGKAWDKATKPGHALVWKSIGEALETASDMMPQFAKRTNSALGVAEKGTTKWMKALRSPEGKQILDTLMVNFNRTLGPVLDGMGSLVGYFAKVAAVASNSMPGIGKTFQAWAKSLNATADGSENFRQRIQKIIQSAKDVGNFFMSAGRLIKAFFAGGVDAGQDFTRSMTRTMDRWTAFLNSTKGQNSLGKFFSESVSGAQALWSAFGPLISSFVRWAASIAPFVRVFFQGAGAVSHMVDELLRLTGLRTPIAALITTLGVLWGIGKISAATRAVSGFTAALLGMNRAAAGGAVANTMRGMGPGMLVGGGLAKSGAQAATAASKFGRFKMAAGGAITALTGLSAASAGWVALAIGVGLAFTHVATRALDYQKNVDAAKKAGENWRESIEKMPELHEATAQAVIQDEQASMRLTTAQKALNKMRAEGKTHTDEYKQAVIDVKQAQLDLTSTSIEYTKAQRAEVSESKKQVKAAQDRVDQAKKAVANKKDASPHSWEDFSILGMGRNIKAAHDTSKEMKALEVAQQRLNRQQELSVLSSMNQARSLQALGPIARGAAKSLAAVQRLGSKNLATQISVRYKDGGDAGRVAGAANRALQAGVKPATIRFIVKDAKTAEDAIRRINQMEIKRKHLQIVNRGGSEAVAAIEKIIGRKLTTKEQRIVERGGKDVLGRLNTIRGRQLAKKLQDIADRGGAGVLGILRQINATQLQDKKQTVTIETVKTTIVKGINTIGNSVTKALTPKKRARGQGAGGAPSNALIGEGRADEWRVNAKTGQAYKTSGPEITRLGSSDAIIPTEPRFKSRGRDIFKTIAKDLGLEGFRKGKKAAKKAAPKGLGDRGKALARGEARKKLPTHRSYSTDNLVELSAVEDAKKKEENQARQISIDERTLSEPTSFMKVVGTDPATGDPIYDIDQNAVNTWAATLETFAKKYDKLILLINNVEAAVRKAMSRLGDPYNSKNHSGIIGKTFANVEKLNSMIAREDRIINGKGTSKKAKDGAKQRKGVYKDAINAELETRNAATADYKQMADEKNDVGFRRQEAQVSANQYRADSAAVAGKAAEEKDSKNPDAKLTAFDPFSAGQSQLSGLEAEQSLAAIGQVIGGNPVRSAAEIAASMQAVNQGIINTAQALLRDADPTNDSSAYSAITSAAQALGGLTGGAGNAATQGALLSSARQDLYASSGNNFAVAGSIGATSGAMSQAYGRTAGNSAAFAPSPAGGPGGIGGVTFNQVFQQMPDPHSWSQGVAFELQASL